MKKLLLATVFAAIASASPSVHFVNVNGPLLAMLNSYFGQQTKPYLNVLIQDVQGPVAYRVTINGSASLCPTGNTLADGTTATVCFIQGDFAPGTQILVEPLMALPASVVGLR